MEGKVSIITPAYNCEKYIRNTYRSIANQTYTDWEWIVTDDCSTDATYSILERLASLDNRIVLFRNSINSGAAVSRNLSLKHASGDFIAFLDSDDFWDCRKLEKQLGFMSDDINFSFTAYNIVDSNGGSLKKTVDSCNAVKVFCYCDVLKKRATMGCSTVMLRRRNFGNIVMPNIRTGQDYALWLSLLKNGERAYLLNDTLTSYRITPGSISRNKFKKAKRQWYIYRKIEKLSIFKSSRCFLCYAYRAAFRIK